MNLIHKWNIHQKRAFYELCIVGEQMIHSGIDYLDLSTALAEEMKKSQDTYIKNAQIPTTAEVPVS